MASNNTDKIGIDLKGRVKRINLAERNMLLPVFEAIVNSIHAIEDAEIKDGKIDIVLERFTQTKLELDENRSIPEVIKFVVKDNGIGFNETNYESFKREYSTHKEERGGLGIGRFTWLKAFYDVKVESYFKNETGNQKRIFSFNTRIPDGIEGPKLISMNGEDRRGSTISLIGYKDPYKSKCPKKAETIANRIIEHCLIYFLSADCPEINLIDGAERINLNRMYEGLIGGNKYIEKLNVQKYKFKVTLLKWFQHEELTYHKISFCANNREIENFNLNKILPDINGKIMDSVSGDEYYVVGYIEGKYFDENKNDERTEVLFKREGLFDEQLISKQDLIEAIFPIIKKHFEKEVANFQERKKERIEQFIAETAPQYRILKKYGQSFDDIVVTENTTEEELDLKLYKLLQNIEFDSRKEVVEILKNNSEDESGDHLKEKYHRVLEELSDLNKSKLAQYVVHRKHILELFEKSLALNEKGKYELEDTIHSIIYPTKTDSNAIDYNNQNLWILDERLSFHTFLSSDKPLNSIEDFEYDSLDRPDLMIFNNPISYVEGDEAPFNSVVLVEFKRPMRNQYNEYDDNPIVQVYDYVREIKKGKKLTVSGRRYDINEHTRFYCYVVCDLNEKIIQYAENAQLERTYDGLGYYGYNKSLRCIIDIMPFNQVLANAKKRNRVLFNKLGI